MSPTPTPSRGEIWLVNFDATVGAEIQKMRLALIISVDSVFFFRPGLEMYSIYKQKRPLKIAWNAVEWLGQ